MYCIVKFYWPRLFENIFLMFITVNNVSFRWSCQKIIYFFVCLFRGLWTARTTPASFSRCTPETEVTTGWNLKPRGTQLPVWRFPVFQIRKLFPLEMFFFNVCEQISSNLTYCQISWKFDFKLFCFGKTNHWWFVL